MAIDALDGFAGQVAVVTGGAGGLGRALAEALGRLRARVVVADVDAAGAAQVAQAIEAAGGRAEAAALDVADAAAVQALIGDVVTRHGRIDLLINNAGFAVAGDLRDIPLADWRRIVEVNLMGVVHGCCAAYPRMVKQGSGHIVNTASLAGLIGAPALTPYATTKAAVIALSTNLRDEAAPHGVKVSVLCPGFIATGIYDAARVARVPNRALFSLIPFKLVPAERAAALALRGVAKNRARIVFPFYARLLWALHRISPRLLAPVVRRAVADFARLRDAS
jgi:NAD(P)-dependent dehydrogenase (short-subunit alcohol dehydrogenase family)